MLLIFFAPDNNVICCDIGGPKLTTTIGTGFFRHQSGQS